MAMLFANPPRMFVLKARRETVLLLIAAVAVTFALAHGHKATAPVAVAPDRGWAGDLAVAAPSETPPTEQMSSASLVVPKAQLALPAPPKPVSRAKAVCDGVDKSCVSRQSVPGVVTAAPPRRQVAALDAGDRLIPPETIPIQAPQASVGRPAQKSFLSSLNPLDHVPDLKTIGRPFASAGNAVGGWIKSF